MLLVFSPHPMDQQVYSCCHKFLTVTQCYNSKNTPIGKFHAVKIAKSVFLYVFTMAFPTSPLAIVLVNISLTGGEEDCSPHQGRAGQGDAVPGRGGPPAHLAGRQGHHPPEARPLRHPHPHPQQSLQLRPLFIIGAVHYHAPCF